MCLLASVFCLLSCGKAPLYQEQGFVFGTLVEVSVYGVEDTQARQAVATVMQEFRRLHGMLHAWKPGELSALNEALAQGKDMRVSPELISILQDAAQLSAQSGGLFNPAIGNLVKLWGFHSDEIKPALPDEMRLAELVRAHPQMSDLAFPAGAPPAGGAAVGSRNRAVRIDLGGYAKGYALDKAAALLKGQGIRNALINIGGNVLALGQHGARAWRIGIQHPRRPGPVAVLDLQDGEAIGTSGDYQHYFMMGGTRYCHLIDPRSGQPAQGVQSVSVLTRGPGAGTLSDAASKPLFVSGISHWEDSARRMNIAEAMVIAADGTVQMTPALRKRLEFTNGETR